MPTLQYIGHFARGRELGSSLLLNNTYKYTFSIGNRLFTRRFELLILPIGGGRRKLKKDFRGGEYTPRLETNFLKIIDF